MNPLRRLTGRAQSSSSGYRGLSPLKTTTLTQRHVRRTGLRIQWGNPSGFKSRLSHSIPRERTWKVMEGQRPVRNGTSALRDSLDDNTAERTRRPSEGHGDPGFGASRGASHRGHSKRQTPAVADADRAQPWCKPLRRLLGFSRLAAGLAPSPCPSASGAAPAASPWRRSSCGA
jgi:hypothetical protein